MSKEFIGSLDLNMLKKTYGNELDIKKLVNYLIQFDPDTQVSICGDSHMYTHVTKENNKIIGLTLDCEDLYDSYRENYTDEEIDQRLDSESSDLEFEHINNNILIEQTVVSGDDAVTEKIKAFLHSIGATVKVVEQIPNIDNIDHSQMTLTMLPKKEVKSVLKFEE